MKKITLKESKRINKTGILIILFSVIVWIFLIRFFQFAN